MGYQLTLKQSEMIALPRGDVQRLLRAADAGAALLYLALVSSDGAVEESKLCRDLHWDKTTLDSAVHALEESGLLGARKEVAPQTAPERPKTDYSRGDITAALEGDAVFSALRREVGEKLNRLMTEKDDNILLGLYNDLGLPADVIFVLVSYCIQRTEARYGTGRRPTMRQVEQEGYRWKRLGLLTQQDAAVYMRERAQIHDKIPAMMQALQLGVRKPVGKEYEFLERWSEWGFTAEAVGYAYEKTVFKCGKFEWKYANGILKDLQKKGLYTLEQIKRGDRPPQRERRIDIRPSAEETSEALRESDAWMDAYLSQIKSGSAQSE